MNEFNVGDLVAWSDWNDGTVKGGMVEKTGTIGDVSYVLVDGYTVWTGRITKVRPNTDFED